jgi:hypothetical protein
MSYFHVKIDKDERCLDLLLTEDEIVNAFSRSLNPDNKEYIVNDCCDCWPVVKPPECTFWRKIMGICKDCEDDTNE